MQAPERLDALVRVARDGDPAALEELLCAIRPALVRLGEHLLGQQVGARADRSDVVQDVLIVIRQKFDSFRGRTSKEFRAWCCAILSNEVLMLVRREHQELRDVDREQPLPDGSDPAAGSSSSSPSGHALRNERAERVRAAIERLPADYRQIIILVDIEEREWSDVAAAMGRSKDAVRKLHMRALAQLQDDPQLQAELGGDA